jgi:ubiquinone/menaquinone biosynthesis C-methylase UbiE
MKPVRDPQTDKRTEASDVIARKKQFYSDAGVVSEYDETRFQSGYGRFKDELERGLFKRHVLLPPNPVILDCGAGTGRFSAFLKESLGNDARLVATDYSRAMLDNARSHRLKPYLDSNVSFVRSDIYALPFADASFDLVTSMHVLIHLPKWEGILSGFHRILKPGGVAYFDLLSADYRSMREGLKKPLAWLPRDSTNEVVRYEDSYHNFVSAKEVEKTLTEVGFTSVRILAYDILYSFYIRNLIGMSRIDRFLDRTRSGEKPMRLLLNLSHLLSARWSPQILVIARK